MTTHRTMALAALLLVTVSTSLAQAPLLVPAELSEVPPPPAAADGTLTLDLEDAYALALRRNLDLQIGRYGLAGADVGILERAGIFDPNLTAGIDGSYAKSPAATQLAGASVTESRTTRFGLGLGQLLPTGTTWDIQAGIQRDETNSQFFFVNPRWGTSLTASLTQPLLRGFGTLVNRSGLVIASNQRDQNAIAFEQSVINTLRQVEEAYWELIRAREAVGVAETSVALAERLLRETNERVKVGTSAPIDTVQSEATAAARRQDLIIARNAAANAEDNLKAALGFDQPEEWLVRIETSESFPVHREHADLARSIEQALESRPDIRQQRLAISLGEFNVKVARNDVLPSLDLRASYGYSGIGGDIRLTDPDTGEVTEIDGGLSDATRQVRDRDFPQWTLGLSLGVPLGNNAAKARLAGNRYALEQAEVELRALQQQIVREVRLAVRAIDDSQAAIDAAVAARELAVRNLEAEQTKFANGLSTNYQVLQIQDDLAQAQLSELNARIAYLKSLIGYRLATGSMLTDTNVRIEDPGAPDAPHDCWKDVEWLQFVDLKDAAARVTRPAAPVNGE